MKNVFRLYFSALAIVFGLSLISLAQTTPLKNFHNVKISNFGQMDERFYRGAQPKKDDYQSLKDLGVKTVIDLRDDATDYEKASVEALGMTYVNIPMDDKSYPKQENIDAFLKLANDPETGIFYVHCAGGRHRTGVAGAIYRMTKYGWGFDQVYQEMKNYDFYTRNGHGEMKDLWSISPLKIKLTPRSWQLLLPPIKTLFKLIIN